MSGQRWRIELRSSQKGYAIRCTISADMFGNSVAHRFSTLEAFATALIPLQHHLSLGI